MLKRRITKNITGVEDALFVKISNGCIQSTGEYMETAKEIEATVYDTELQMRIKIKVSIQEFFAFYIREQRANHKYSGSFDTLHFGTRISKDGQVTEIYGRCWCKTKARWDEARKVWILAGVYSLGGDPLVIYDEITREEYNS